MLSNSASSALIVMVKEDPSAIIDQIRKLHSEAVIVPINFNVRPSCKRQLTEIPDQVHLTARQIEVLHHVILGHTNKQIGRILNISGFTVRNHVSKLLRLLNVRTRWQLRALNVSEPCAGANSDTAIEGTSRCD